MAEASEATTEEMAGSENADDTAEAITDGSADCPASSEETRDETSELAAAAADDGKWIGSEAALVTTDGFKLVGAPALIAEASEETTEETAGSENADDTAEAIADGSADCAASSEETTEETSELAAATTDVGRWWIPIGRTEVAEAATLADTIAEVDAGPIIAEESELSRAEAFDDADPITPTADATAVVTPALADAALLRELATDETEPAA